MKQPSRLWALMAGLLLLSAFLVWHDLAAREVLGQDENATITKLDQPDLKAVLDVTYIKITGQPGNMQPLYFLVQHLFWPLVGSSAFVLRFLPSVLTLLTVAVTFKLGEALLDRTAGLVGALLVALLPLDVHYAQIARPYSLLALLLLASAFFLVRALATNRFVHWAGFALTAALGFYTHLNALFVLAAEGAFAGIVWLVTLVAVLKKRQPAGKLAGPVLSFVALALLCLPGALRLLALPWASEGGEVTVQLSADFFIRYLYRIGVVGPWLRNAILIAMALGLAVLLYRRRWQSALLAVLWLAVPFLVLAVMKSPRPFAERYVIFVPPLALLLAGQGVAALGQGAGYVSRHWHRQVVQATVVTAACLGLVLFLVGPLQAYYAANRESNRIDQTLVVVERYVQPGDLIVVSPRFLTRPLAANGAEVLYLEEHPAPGELDQLVSKHQRTWILYTSYLPPVELQEPLDQWVQAHPDDFVRVPIKAITAVAYHNQAMADEEARLQDRVAVLQDLAAVSPDGQEGWQRYEALAETLDALSALYNSRGLAALAQEYHDKAEQARATVPRPW